jgi:hypothetical protein
MILAHLRVLLRALIAWLAFVATVLPDNISSPQRRLVV